MVQEYLNSFLPDGVDDICTVCRNKASHLSHQHNEGVSMYAATRGFMDDVPVASVQAFERDFLDFIRGAKSDILDDIVARKVLDADLEARLKDAILEFKKGYNA